MTNVALNPFGVPDNVECKFDVTEDGQIVNMRPSPLYDDAAPIPQDRLDRLFGPSCPKNFDLFFTEVNAPHTAPRAAVRVARQQRLQRQQKEKEIRQVRFANWRVMHAVKFLILGMYLGAIVTTVTALVALWLG